MSQIGSLAGRYIHHEADFYSPLTLSGTNIATGYTIRHAELNESAGLAHRNERKKKGVASPVFQSEVAGREGVA
ncbi:hypothetical protein E2C01_023355 [Portunus trituberculatus]|uniref:Uncharacterized protein n=1 Tax=Portunus trituberculatus TaxID=210409 RepID=A0A5B7E9K6_PORTR|nr:hypothetical protein [Portunus trituberculatus]